MEIKKVKEYLKDKEIFCIFKNGGMFDGVSDIDAQKLMEKINELIKLLLETISKSILDTLMIPIVIRAFKNHSHLIKSPKNVISYVESKSSILEELSISGLEGEAEFCALMAEQISNLKL